MIRRFRLGRRAMLRGAGLGGVSIALPMLDAMMTDREWVYRGARAAGPLPVRLLTFFFPCGWTGCCRYDETTITARALSETSLKQFAGSIVAINNVSKQALAQSSTAEGGGGHADLHGTFATGFPVDRSGAGGPSIDCIAAAWYGGDTKYRSIAVALGEPFSLQHDTMSWSARQTPVPADRDPQKLFNKLFKDQAPPVGARDYRKSMLDYVRADLARLNGRLGASDRMRLDQYLSNLRDLEQALFMQTPLSCTAPGAPPGGGASDMSKTRAQTLIRLLVTALQCDLTRYGSFQLCSSANGRQFPWLGLGNVGGHIDPADPASPFHSGHHGLSHQSDPASLDMLIKICFDEIDDFAYMLDLMQKATEGSGNLLQSSIIFLSNECQNGAHLTTDMPVLVAGGAGAKLKGGRSIDARGKSYSSVLCSVLNYAGVVTDKFGYFNDPPLAGL